MNFCLILLQNLLFAGLVAKAFPNTLAFNLLIDSIINNVKGVILASSLSNFKKIVGL